MANQGLDVNQYLNDQYQEERNSEIARILAEPLAVNPLLASSNDSDDTNIVSSYRMYTLNGSKRFIVRGSGYAFGHQLSTILYTSDGNSFIQNGWLPSNPSNYITFTLNQLNPYILYADLINSSGGTDRFNFYTSFPSDNSDVVVQYSSTFWGSDYLSNVAEIFSWILDHIAEIITFILGNAFLSVSLLLFMCGAVISFYVRIRRS